MMKKSIPRLQNMTENDIRNYLGIYWYDIQNNIGKDILSCFVVGNLIAEYVVTEMNIEQHIVRNLGVMNR